ncbi:DNA topoisomerase IV subunit B [Porphyromonas circumdentaria]|uniref:DNA topoisomerase (ATP-hydrolyzing) n=1 Tax=Porphyromonas circumdentaria TaxID=29524 RepID=A0A1T4N4C6_9PORP|nr:DNA topoisomerase IV subunit B [Porphyromonas circumdentaria]MBB6276025.1 topoisomerase-4 subunit B [Porphyromonas circumdentaria]MDO4722415.1 DNA topoisomerase IV subunit B [Porphyromonas circumdentaria]SJZ73994.1 topoisomerase-4 subunit B [Porphyromonas circumdentaria]
MSFDAPKIEYNEADFTTLSWDEHIRRRPGMYIGKLGDGSLPDDGIYVLLKEVIDNSVDEFVMGQGKTIEITIADGEVTVRDYGRGIPLGKLNDAVSRMNTGAKIDSQAFKKSVGLNGVGLKAVNALSQKFVVQSFRDGFTKKISYSSAQIQEEEPSFPSEKPSGTLVSFIPDPKLFKNYAYRNEIVISMVRNYTFLNAGLTIIYNGRKYQSKNGLKDLLSEDLTGDPLYPIIHLEGEDIEVAITHVNQYGEEFYSFVNGQNTTQGGTHLSAFREAVARVIKEFFSKNFDYSDIRSGMAAAISLKVVEPTFESQTKTKLGSKDMVPDEPQYKNEPLKGVSIQRYIGDFLKDRLDDFLHIHSAISEVLLKKIQDSERERKAISGVAKLARERAKKANLHNKKLRDCSVHFNDSKAKDPERTSIFITEGNSASGSITTSRDPKYQAVFSLRGKPLNCFGLTKKIVYENEEFNLLQAALNIEDGMDGLRYNRIIIATDADDDGMHIRLLMLTFFLQFFPDLVRKGHVFVLETPLYRVTLPPAEVHLRRKKRGVSLEEYTYYCYTEEERDEALSILGKKAELTRFKGLGEISADEFKGLISEENIKLKQVTLRREDTYKHLLDFYMGKNTPERQDFIIGNLLVGEE